MTKGLKTFEYMEWLCNYLQEYPDVLVNLTPFGLKICIYKEADEMNYIISLEQLDDHIINPLPMIIEQMRRELSQR